MDAVIGRWDFFSDTLVHYFGRDWASFLCLDVTFPCPRYKLCCDIITYLEGTDYRSIKPVRLIYCLVQPSSPKDRRRTLGEP
jgi:hypothetical protein